MAHKLQSSRAGGLLMHGRLDQIVPGLLAKLRFAFDEIFLAFAIIITALGGQNASDARVTGLIFAGTFGWFCAAALLRLYSPCTPRTKADGVLLTLVGVAGVVAALTLADMTLAPAGEPPLSLGAFATFFGAATTLGSIVFSIVQRIEPASDDVLILGTGPAALDTYRRLTRGPERRRVIGVLRFRGQPDKLWGAEAEVLGEVDDLERVLATRPVGEVYLAAPLVTYGAQMQQAVKVCEDVGMPFALPMHPFEFERAALLSPAAGGDDYLHYLAARRAPWQVATKRLIDIVASTLALLVLSPLLVSVALAIKLTSPGPVLFRQKRVGLHGSTFNLFKFRSMRRDAEALRDTLLARNEQTGPVF